MHFRRSYYSLKLSLQFISEARNQFKTQKVFLKIFDCYIFLDQQVDTLEFITVFKKIQTIASLQFSMTLKALKIYLDLTD